MSGDQPLALLIEDDLAICRFLRASLLGEGWRLIEAHRGAEGQALALQHAPDLVLVDLGLPDVDGVQVIRALRGWYEAPILVLSARDRERSKVEALDAGADDYLTKPFGLPELLARIRAVTRRVHRAEPAPPVFVQGSLRVDVERRRVWRDQEEVHLSPTEFKLLAMLVRHAGRVVTQDQLLRAVWGPNAVQQPHYLRVYMAHLRRKLEPEGDGRLFVTEAGVGYRLREE